MVGDMEQTQSTAPQEPVAEEAASVQEGISEVADAKMPPATETEPFADDSDFSDAETTDESNAQVSLSEEAIRGSLPTPEVDAWGAPALEIAADGSTEAPCLVDIMQTVETMPSVLAEVEQKPSDAEQMIAQPAKQEISAHPRMNGNGNGFGTAQVLLTVLPILGLCLWFVYIMRDVALPGLLISACLLALICVLYTLFVPKLLGLKQEALQPLFGVDLRSRRAGRKYRLPEIFWVAGALIAFRIAIAVLAHAFRYAHYGYLGTFFQDMKFWANFSDAPHYLDIAQRGYVSEANSLNYEYLQLVFLPFYSYVVRFFSLFSTGTARAGFFVSNLSTVLGGVVFYRLMLFDYDRKVARRAIFYYCVVPISFILSATMSDGLFFLLSVSSLYAARKRNFLLAGILGALTAYTRILGVLVFAPIFLEYLQSYWARPERVRIRSFSTRQFVNGLVLLLIPLGLGIYLYQNWRISGNPLQFLIYQKDNWYQGFYPFFRTPAYQLDYMLGALAEGNWRTVFGLSLPNLLAIFLSTILLIGQHKKLRASYIAYGGLYIIVSISTSWLLSAPRYLFCCFPILMALALATKKRWVDILVSMGCAAAYLVYFYIYVTNGPVY